MRTLGRDHRSELQNDPKGELPRQVSKGELQLGLREPAAPETAEVGATVVKTEGPSGITHHA